MKIAEQTSLMTMTKKTTPILWQQRFPSWVVSALTLAVMSMQVVVLELRPVWASESQNYNNYYGFVSYLLDEAEPLDDAFTVIKRVGGGWAQAEGPITFTTSAHWGNIQLVSLTEYDWSSLEWTNRATAAGLCILLNVSSGHDQMGMESYCPWVDCQAASGIASSTRCPPLDYQQWYEYAYEVARHFDGSSGAPEIRYFMSTGENDDSPEYWIATKEEYYGGGDLVTITRKNGLGTVEIYAAQLPVLYLGIKDGNSQAKVVMGCSSAYRGYAWTHIKEKIDQGCPEQEVVEQAYQYGLNQTYSQIVTNISSDPAIIRSIAFFYQSLLFPEYYDIFAIHYYGPAGYKDAVNFVCSKLADAGITKEIWNTGEGKVILGTSDLSERRNAYLHLERILTSQTAGFSWHDTSFLVDFVFSGPSGLYGRSAGGLDYPVRHYLANTFSFLSHILPEKNSATPVSVTPPEADTELLVFQVQNSRGTGSLAGGWCLDECPQNVLVWCNIDCPKTHELNALLGIGSSEARALFDFTGTIISATCSGETTVTFDEAPFLLAWGPDRDGDCVPDIIDNCPDTFNPGQENNPLEAIMGNGNPAIPAPDFLGDLCDPCPSDGDPDCSPTVPALSWAGVLGLIFFLGSYLLWVNKSKRG
ncbi:thrombospondin type 3 repeat-containing protein [candidate division CSSED10-310 bacterium]|uniref:Thrombospondin type 3 repeat-containing protein n=1 Tax=candidate division CSSED10-310 bacterium TaxID=2855610 RepID=A0ABV6Z1C2_UNCC1